MIFAIFQAQIDTVKRFLEKWQHRLQGHMNISVSNEYGYYQFWARDIYSEDGLFYADITDDLGPFLLSHKNVTITGA